MTLYYDTKSLTGDWGCDRLHTQGAHVTT